MVSRSVGQRSDFELDLGTLVARDGQLGPTYGYVAATKVRNLLKVAPGNGLSLAELAAADRFLVGIERREVLDPLSQLGGFAVMEIAGEEILYERGSLVARTDAPAFPRYQSRFEAAAAGLPKSSPVRALQGLGTAPLPLARLSARAGAGTVVELAGRHLLRVDREGGGVVSEMAAACAGNALDGSSAASLKRGVRYMGWARPDLLAVVVARFGASPMEVDVPDEGRPGKVRLRDPSRPAPAPAVPAPAQADRPVTPAAADPGLPARLPDSPAERVRRATEGLLGPLGALRIAAITARAIRSRS